MLITSHNIVIWLINDDSHMSSRKIVGEVMVVQNQIVKKLLFHLLMCYCLISRFDNSFNYFFIIILSIIS